jgi:hypothetical protein
LHLQDEDSEESEENDQYLQLDEDEFQQVLQEVGDAWAVSFDGRCSKSRALTYTSFVLSPKIGSLQHEWQKPGSVRTILELKGGDDYANIKANSEEFWKEVKQITDGTKKIIVNIQGRQAEVKVLLKYPADMKSHWELFHCGGRAGVNGVGKPDHKCNCSYNEMGRVFDLHSLTHGDTLNSIAKSYGIDLHELDVINIPPDTYEKAEAKVYEEQLMVYQSKEHANGPTVWNSPTKKENIAHLFQNPDLPILKSLGRQSGSIRVHKQWKWTVRCPPMPSWRSHIWTPRSAWSMPPNGRQSTYSTLSWCARLVRVVWANYSKNSCYLIKYCTYVQ